MNSNKFKDYFERMCIIFLCSSFIANDVVVKVGHSTTLKCVFAESERPSNCFYIIWMKISPPNRTVNVINVDGRKFTVYDKGPTTSCDVIIHDATPEDTGLYYCSNEKAKSFIGDGTKVRVIAEIDVSPSVELFSPSEFEDPNIPLICWATDTSEVRVIWVVNGEEHIGWTESVWSKQNDPSTEFTQSQFWISKSDWEDGILCTCIVEAGGKNFSKSIQSKPRREDDVCLFLLYGISCAALLMIFVAVTAVVVLYKGQRIKDMQKMDNRRQNTGKHGKYTTKSSFLTEVQYASLDNINFREPPQNPLQEDFELET